MRKVGSFLVVVALGVTLWFSGVMLQKIGPWMNLKEATRGSILSWELVELEEGRYTPLAHYRYEVGGKFYTAISRLEGVVYLNRDAAEKQLLSLSRSGPDDGSWPVWYSAADPSQSQLQREFPLKACVQMAISLAVFLYFVMLRGFLEPDELREREAFES